jgi:hypothetical protein
MEFNSTDSQDVVRQTARVIGATYEVPVAPRLGEHESTSGDVIAQMKAAHLEYSNAQKALHDAKENLKRLYDEFRKSNQADWGVHLQHAFGPSIPTTVHGVPPPALDPFIGPKSPSATFVVVRLVNNDLRRVFRVDPSDSTVLVGPPRFVPPDELSQPQTTQWVPFTQIRLGPDGSALSVVSATETRQLRDDFELAQANFLKASSGQCPQPPCSKCGHRYCYSYHQVDPSDLGGWVLCCAHPTCTCFHCTKARKNNPRAQSHELHCCQCNGCGRGCSCDYCKYTTSK